MPNYLKAAKNAKTPEARRRFARLHREQKLREKILDCTNCKLRETCTAPVPWTGNTRCKVVLVGEGPGRHEDEQGEPFVGPSGRLLNKCLGKAGLERSEAMILNVVCCRPPNNRAPELGEIMACESNLEKQLNLASAYVGVLLGQSAYKAVLRDMLKDTGMPKRYGDVVGTAIWAQGRIWIPAYHPAYLLRNRSMQYTLVDALTRARKTTEGSVGWPRLDAKHFSFTEDPGEGLRKRLDSLGYAQMYSARLEDVILIVRDENIRPPTQLRSLPRYTMAELVKIGMAGKAGNRMTVGDLHAIHLVKAELGGKVLI